MNKQFEKRKIITALLSPWIGFLAASPFILISFKTFYDQLSYEVWHYAVAGHENNSANPGIEQILHYSKWLLFEGVGFIAFIAALLAICLFIKKKIYLPLTCFAALFFILMCAQKANFTRNMLVAIPIMSVFAGSFLSRFTTKSTRLTKGLKLVIICILLAQPIYRTAHLLQSSFLTKTDTRTQLIEKLKDSLGDKTGATTETIYISGKLQIHPSVYSLPGVKKVDLTKIDLNSLWQDGVDRIVIHPARLKTVPGLYNGEIIKGEDTIKRVPRSPSIGIYKTIIDPSQELKFATLDLQKIKESEEGHIWTTKRRTKITNNQELHSSNFQIMSPWRNQTVSISEPGKTKEKKIILKEPGKWYQVDIPNNAIIINQIVSSPSEHGINLDQRVLGIAIKRKTSD